LTVGGLAGPLANVASLVVDTDATCLSGRPVSHAVHADGPATISLSDGRTITFAGEGDHAGEMGVVANARTGLHVP
jgi:hypothetical protein